MGEFIKHPKTGKVIKIGTMNECAYTRKHVLRFKEEGYKGFYMGEYDDTLEKIISSPYTLYPVETETVYDTLFCVPFLPNTDKNLLPTAGAFKHDAVHFHINGKYQYQVQCQEKDNLVVYAKVIGEQYLNEVPVTILACHCCNTRFAIDRPAAMLLRNLYPEYRDCIHSYMDYKYSMKADDPAADFKDLGLIETLEIVASSFEERNFVRLVGPSNGIVYRKVERAIVEDGYPTLHNFWLRNRELIPCK